MPTFQSPLDILLAKGNLSKSVSSLVKKSRSVFIKRFPELNPRFEAINKTDDLSTENLQRTKRVAPLVVTRIVSLLISTGVSIYQQVELSDL